MTRKLDKEHLDELQSLRDQFNKICGILGSIAIERFAIERQLENLKTEHDRYIQQYGELQQSEEQIIEKLRAHYGEGQIDLAQGTFTADNGLVK
jgi:hypothetical protein